MEATSEIVIKVRLTNKYIFEEVATYYNAKLKLSQHQSNIRTNQMSDLPLKIS